MKKFPELIFHCKKCEHLVYVAKDIKKIISMLHLDCPECGEEPYENWVLTGEGNYSKEFNKE